MRTAVPSFTGGEAHLIVKLKTKIGLLSFPKTLVNAKPKKNQCAALDGPTLAAVSPSARKENIGTSNKPFARIAHGASTIAAASVWALLGAVKRRRTTNCPPERKMRGLTSALRATQSVENSYEELLLIEFSGTSGILLLNGVVFGSCSLVVIRN
ncbi:hypothetical protein [Mesorhizobium australafricanum]|uniref:Uncharacterized protein n=1 Tax=Mesorhizobium australafricanum TaxID=3072311 RepID=A0ABU4X596_9HYPH|nr:hypothetical protein [Mesorhizobium sp. VK3E]MDX8442400.1 hypothetical protein [Mesorhizobium sp. VK3E]